MTSCIYQITDLRNGLKYIGRTKNVKNRKWKHFCYINPEKYSPISLESEKNMEIHKAMMNSKKAEDFLFEILEECPEDKLDEREQYWISVKNTRYPNGYNKTDGGTTYPHSKGEEHYNHKITEKESIFIKKMLIDGHTFAEIQKKVPNATIGIISAINNGQNWKDKKLKYPLCQKFKRLSDEEILEIRTKSEEGALNIDLATEYNTSADNIYLICHGKTHKNIGGPIKEKQKEKKKKEKKIPTFNEEEVNYYREQYYIINRKIVDLYKEYCNNKKNTQITYDTFKSMINGHLYKQYKIYTKEQKTNHLISRNEQIRELAKNTNLSKKEIAHKFNCSERTVYRAINKENRFE